MTPLVESSEDAPYSRRDGSGSAAASHGFVADLLVVRSRQVRVAGIARTEQACVGPGAVRSPGVQASLGIDRRRDPPRPAIAIELGAPALWEVACRTRHRLQAFPSLCRSARKEEG
jgi:hypothetical protein